MAATFIGDFLLSKKLITEDELLRCIELQKASNLMLGEIAVNLSMLDIAQANTINQRQIREDKRFGDLAKELGYLTDTQIDRLLQDQKNHNKYLGEIMLEEGVITRPELETQLQQHRLQREGAAKFFESSISDHQLQGMVKAAIDLSCKMFMRTLKVQCHFANFIEDVESLAVVSNVSFIEFSADKPYLLGIGCGNETMVNIASNFVSLDRAECNIEFSKDALGEFLNIIVGQVVIDIYGVESEFEIERTVSQWAPCLTSLLNGKKQYLDVIMMSQLGEFHLFVADAAIL